ncbi:MAG: sugar ABC transporter permease [Ruminococcaceae bacterium]|nr:sugar ABC transporter permease [Oscillospiraceae bacterium]
MKNPIKRYFPIFVMPTLLAFAVAFLIPFVLGFILSFTEFRTVSDATFVGLENYIIALRDDSTFLPSLWFTVKFAVVSVITINVIAFLLALMLTRTVPGTSLFRTVFFMPNLIGGIVLGYIWQVIINGVLYNFNYSITSNANFGFWGLIILMNWQMIGYMMIIYIAGIQNIPTDILEAARVDGAGALTILRKITIPSVMPSITICLFLTITNSFKLFDQNLALTAGAPANKTQMVALDIYNTFYSRTGFEGVGQAKAVIFFIIVAIIALAQLKFTRGKEVES